MSIDAVAGPSIARILSDAEALYDASSIAQLCDNVPAPRVTLDLPASEPEPLHVFVWGTARDFGVLGMLTGSIYRVSFHVWLTVVATASTADEAVRIANAYQAIALQITLCDTTLGGLAEEIGAPAIKESDTWADADGRRHAGYLLDYEVAVLVTASSAARSIIEAASAAGKE